MKNVSTALLALLNSSTTYLQAEFYTITPKVGSVITYSTADLSLTYNIPGQSVASGTVYNPLGGMRIKRGTMKMMVGTQVDEMDITLYPSPADLINGQPVAFEVLNGALDGAWVSVDRAFLSSWSSAGIVGTVNVFAGRVSDAQAGRTSVTLTVRSPLELLNLNFPRNVFQPGCLHNLYDSGCTLNPNSFKYTGVVGPNPTASTIGTGIFGIDGFFVLGYIVFTSGVLLGQSRSVTYSNGTTGGIAVAYPFPAVPSAGDSFNIFPGCDHSQVTCVNKFNNLANFRGQPFIPQPETAQ